MSGTARGVFYFAAAIALTVIARAAEASTMGSLAPHDADANSVDRQLQEWIADPQSKCRAFDSDFDPDDTITWHGDCTAGTVSGAGTLSFFSHGRTIETITGTFAAGVLQTGRVSAVWSDGSKYEGNQSGGQFDGMGTFVSAKGDRLDGQWKAGALNGKATVAWANGDRYEGEWKNGKSDGQGTEVWANGDRYEGEWKNGSAEGHGVQTWAHGQTYDGNWHNDLPARTVQLAGADDHSDPVAPPPPPGPKAASPSSTAPMAPADPSPPLVAAVDAQPGDSAAGNEKLPLHAILGKTLLAVDGSVVELNSTEGGFQRVVTLPNGANQLTYFTFMNDRIGTVSNESTATGLFRATDDGLAIDYADGLIETMEPISTGGLAIEARRADGVASCTTWYPPGHVFSQSERKAAVEEYAIRLGVVAAVVPGKHRTVRPASRACSGATLARAAGTGAVAPAVETAGGLLTNSHPVLRSASAAEETPASGNKLQAPPGSVPHDMQRIPVRNSFVHVIEQPSGGNNSQARVEEVKFAPDAAPALPAPALQSEEPSPQASSNASECLSVASNGEYWGFQNRCARVVQFAYCEMSDANPLTSCRHTSISGSVAANGFSSLVSDRSLSERDVKHDFRWMACQGGAGEVVPRLDGFDPPTGRCMRAIASAE